MNPYVVDSSVAIKIFFREIYFNEARLFFESQRDLHAPDFLTLELNSVLLKKEKRKEITTAESLQTREKISSLPVQLVPSMELLPIAYPFALQMGCSFYDALYLAVAIQRNARLVTADRRLYNNLSTGPFSKHVLWVEDLPK